MLHQCLLFLVFGNRLHSRHLKVRLKKNTITDLDACLLELNRQRHWLKSKFVFKKRLKNMSHIHCRYCTTDILYEGNIIAWLHCWSPKCIFLRSITWKSGTPVTAWSPITSPGLLSHSLTFQKKRAVYWAGQCHYSFDLIVLTWNLCRTACKCERKSKVN